ncbi:MAG: hypothetical protein MZU97_03345 [Bacillus subtilis]|nr:hypothetical protein [Bacillus subtilis]
MPSDADFVEAMGPRLQGELARQMRARERIDFFGSHEQFIKHGAKVIAVAIRGIDVFDRRALEIHVGGHL